MPSKAYTWVVEQRRTAGKPWRVRAIDTEQSGLDIHTFLESKRIELAGQWSFATDPNTRLTIYQWSGSK